MKGVELGTLKRMSEVIAEVTGADPDRVGVVSGPNLAKEIASREPAASVVACADEDERHAAAGALPLRDVPALLQHRRGRAASSAAPTRTSSRLSVGMAVGARLRRQHHRLGDHPRASPRSPGWPSSSAPTR